MYPTQHAFANKCEDVNYEIGDAARAYRDPSPLHLANVVWFKDLAVYFWKLTCERRAAAAAAASHLRGVEEKRVNRELLGLRRDRNAPLTTQLRRRVVRGSRARAITSRLHAALNYTSCAMDVVRVHEHVSSRNPAEASTVPIAEVRGLCDSAATIVNSLRVMIHRSGSGKGNPILDLSRCSKSRSVRISLGHTLLSKAATTDYCHVVKRDPSSTVPSAR